MKGKVENVPLKGPSKASGSAARGDDGEREAFSILGLGQCVIAGSPGESRCLLIVIIPCPGRFLSDAQFNSRNSFGPYLLSAILKDRLYKALRDGLGGTYSVSVDTFNYQFGREGRCEITATPLPSVLSQALAHILHTLSQFFTLTKPISQMERDAVVKPAIALCKSPSNSALTSRAAGLHSHASYKHLSSLQAKVQQLENFSVDDLHECLKDWGNRVNIGHSFSTDATLTFPATITLGLTPGVVGKIGGGKVKKKRGFYPAAAPPSPLETENNRSAQEKEQWKLFLKATREHSLALK